MKEASELAGVATNGGEMWRCSSKSAVELVTLLLLSCETNEYVLSGLCGPSREEISWVSRDPKD